MAVDSGVMIVLTLGFVLGFVVASLSWWGAYRELTHRYARMARDERRYFELWLESVASVDNSTPNNK